MAKLSPGTPPFLLRLLGPPRIEGPDGMLGGPATQRHRLALLALLALARNHVQGRDTLIAMLWPESSASAGRQLLSVAVHAVRRATGDGTILTEGTALRLDSQWIRVDVVEFETAADAGDLGVAASLYSGPLLEGFALPGALELDHWMDAERDRVERKYQSVLDQLAQKSAQAGDATEEVRWLRLRLARSPTEGGVVQHLMQALERAGDRAGAMQAARTHAALLQEEFGAGPDPHVAALADRLREASSAEVIETPAIARAARLDVEPNGGSPAAKRSGPRPLTLAAVAVAATLTTFGAYERFRENTANGSVDNLATVATRNCAADAIVPLLHRERRAASIAVLPFTGSDSTLATRLFVEGIQNQVHGQLTGIGSIDVIGPAMAAMYRDCDRPPVVIGRELGVATVLVGNALLLPNTLRLSLTLFDVDDGRSLWANEYEREVNVASLLEIHSEIARNVASALRVEITLKEKAQLADNPTTSTEAYRHYLSGEVYLQRVDVENALTEFDAAIQADSSYGLAWSGLARARAVSYFTGQVFGGTTPAQIRAASRSALRRARALAPSRAETQLAEGLVRLYVDEDYDAAFDWFMRASQSRPSDAEPFHWMALARVFQLRFDEAIEFGRSAVERDPFNLGNTRDLAWSYAVSWRFTDAKRYFELAGAMAPEDPFILFFRIGVLIHGFGDTSAVRQHLQRLPRSHIAGYLRATLAVYRRDLRALETAVEDLESPPAERLELLTRGYRALGRPDLTRIYGDSMVTALQASMPSTTQGALLARALQRARLAVGYALVGDSQRAIATVETAIREADRTRDRLNSPTVYMDELRVYAILGRGEEAAPRLERLFAPRDRGGLRSRDLTPKTIDLDPDYDTVRNSAAVRAVLERFRQIPSTTGAGN